MQSSKKKKMGKTFEEWSCHNFPSSYFQDQISDSSMYHNQSSFDLTSKLWTKPTRHEFDIPTNKIWEGNSNSKRHTDAKILGRMFIWRDDLTLGAATGKKTANRSMKGHFPHVKQEFQIFLRTMLNDKAWYGQYQSQQKQFKAPSNVMI